MDIEISPCNTLVVLLLMIGFLLIANIMGIVSKYVFDHDIVFGLVNLFDLNEELNLPTFYSALQLIIGSALLALIGAKHRANGANYIPWLALAVIFLILAVDEKVRIHERFTPLFRTAFDLKGLQYVAWVIPYGFAVLVFVVAFSRFLFRLPRETTRRFIASGAIYVTGAIGVEYMGARHAASYGPNNIVFSMFYTCEELLELLGVAFFIYALLAYISKEFQYLRFTIRD